MTIYILKLKNNKYYVGLIKKNDLNNDTPEKHFSGEGNNWTKKYKPIKILKVFPYIIRIDEIVIKLMIKYGIDNVRGGSYNSIILSYYKQDEIKKKIDLINQKNHNKIHYVNFVPIIDYNDVLYCIIL